MTIFGYKKMFCLKSPVNDVDDNRWNELAAFMGKILPDEKKDSPLPAGYTYLAQFIDHDISLDSQNRTKPWDFEQNPKPVFNLRTPFFDLETIYGKIEPENGEIPRSELLQDKSHLKLRFTIGEGISPNVKAERSYPNDLPRNPDLKAAIVDRRNDENFLVAQIQTAFIKFHNAVVNLLGEKDSVYTFEKARKIVIRHYQYIILNDFLPKIVDREIINEALNGKFYFWKDDFEENMLPLEFSLAAFRMGHCMIRNSYNVNRTFPNAGLNDLFSLTGLGHRVKKREGVPSIWLLNWKLFFDIDNSAQNLSNFNFAKTINTKISPMLNFLGGNFKFIRDSSLSALDLYRGRAFRLDSGQAVANEIINAVNNGNPTLPPKKTPDQSDLEKLIPESLHSSFLEKTPLWFYLMAESEIENKQKLGQAGARIVAETFVKILAKSPFSILKEKMEDDRYFLAQDKKTFGMTEMFKLIFAQNFDELNPLD